MKKKKFMWLVSSALSLCVLVTACGTQTSGTPADNSKSVVSTEASSTNAGEPGPVLKEKITLKILTSADADYEIGNDMPVIQELEKLTNVHLDFELLPVENAAERFTSAMAAKEQYDIVTWSKIADINKYGQEGYFIPLQDLVKQNAPNIQKAFEDPLTKEKLPYKMNIKAELTAPDGNLYNIPVITAGSAIGRVYAIREDWLNKLNLKMPETVDELYIALKAFKENDPNGNGKNDEIPLMVQDGGTYYLMTMVNFYGAHQSLYLDKADDTIKYGLTEPEWKDGISFLNKLYKEGIFDKEFETSDSDRWKKLVSNNQVGMMYVWPAGGIGASNNELKKIDASYRYVPMAPVKAPNGARFKDTSTAGSIISPRTSITATNKYPVETIKYLDFLFSDKGTELSSYGILGKHFSKVNEKYVISENILNNPDGLDAETARLKDGVCFQCLPYIQGWDPDMQVMAKTSPSTVDAWTLYREPGMVEAPMPSLNFTDEENKELKTISDMYTYAGAHITPFITGKESLDKVDDYTAQVKKMGGDVMCKVYNQAYARYKKLAAGN